MVFQRILGGEPDAPSLVALGPVVLDDVDLDLEDVDFASSCADIVFIPRNGLV